tara:strand:- start:17724 stop:18113 length:390 start_codon:yes stop_codon:yes gene_type:complete
MFNEIFEKQFRINALISKFKLFPNRLGYQEGLIYTLYSDQFNLIEVGFADNNKIIEDIIKRKKFILLDKKYGKKVDFSLLKDTLRLLGVELFKNKYFKYSEKRLRHLNTLDWPIGNSLYKKRIIRKKFL